MVILSILIVELRYLGSHRLKFFEKHGSKTYGMTLAKRLGRKVLDLPSQRSVFYPRDSKLSGSLSGILLVRY